MFPSYQTVPLANAPKDERSSPPVPRTKKGAVAAMMVGMALLVVGYSDGDRPPLTYEDEDDSGFKLGIFAKELYLNFKIVNNEPRKKLIKALPGNNWG